MSNTSIELEQALTVSFAGAKREVIMSYGLLNSLMRVIKSPEDLGQVRFDPEHRDAVLSAILVERDARGKPVGDFDRDSLNALDILDVERILDWVQGHITGFFLRAKVSFDRLEQQLKANSMPSSNGSAA